MNNTPLRARRRAPRNVRRQELVDAALAQFAARGLDATTVDDIVQAAGVAKGTFYLYFSSKDDAVNAVAERLVTRVGERVADIASRSDLSPVDRLRALGQTLNEVGREPYERELVEMLHRPANRAMHDRISERALTQLAPLLASIIRDGIDADLFGPQDAELSAAFVLGTFSLLHHVVHELDDLPVAIAQLDCFILRGLGYGGELRRD